MQRATAIIVFLGLTSCTVRLGSEVRRAPPPMAMPAPAPALASRPIVVATPRALPKRGLGRFRDPRGLGRGPGRTAPANDSSLHDSSVAQLCVDEINRYRATLGLRPLERAADRESCADGQIRDDASSGRWHGSFGGCGEGAQNECMSSATDRGDMIKGCLKGMWNEGPGGGHYENMKGSATKVWCGFHTKPNGDVWSVQDFR